jgi:CRISPR/Cas system-associated protein Cas10 (large subunit of type III CRISPR-Cas system)
MWKGYENALKEYYNSILMEWINRGYKNTMQYETINVEYPISYPFWFGKTSFHASHRSNLLRKNKEYYSKFDWKEQDNLPYIWYK